MRQKLSEKSVRKLRQKLNLPIVKALVRGNTDHRIDLYLEDGTDVCYWRWYNGVPDCMMADKPLGELPFIVPACPADRDRP